MTLGELFAGIANAIRSKDGTTDRIPALTFPERILAISGSGGGGGPFCKVSVMEGYDGEILDLPVNLSAVVSVTAEDYRKDYEVVSVDGADYGFALNTSGYYESQNKGVSNSFAMCKIVFNFSAAGTATLNCINHGEANYDYGLISEVDTMLSMDNNADSSGVLKNFYGQSSASVVSVQITVPAGEHFICVKFRKDSSSNLNSDTLRFAVSL